MARPDSHPFKDASRGPRLQRILADAGVGSRRACEDLILSGAVTVNGIHVRSLPAFAHPTRDRIAVNGRRIRSAAQPVVVMLFKPRGVVCTNSDPEGRPRAIDLVRHPSKVRLYPVGRLDIDSSGLLLLTNDGELANRLTHPRHGVHKTYEVTVAGQVTDDDVARLERGIVLTNQRKRISGARGAARPAAARTAESRVRIIKRDREKTHLHIELGEGQNRQIRRMLARLDFDVKKLRRVQMGPLKLKGLQPGQWRDLEPKELAALRRAAGYERDE